MDLPDLLEIEHFGGSWDNYLDAAYKIYCDEVVNGNLDFMGIEIKCPWHPPFNDKHFSFWHIISQASSASTKEEDREPDFERIKRIRWIPFILKISKNQNEVLCWNKIVKTKRGRKTHLQILHKNSGFMIVLRKAKNRYDIVTAYRIKNPGRKIAEYDKVMDPRKA